MSVHLISTEPAGGDAGDSVPPNPEPRPKTNSLRRPCANSTTVLIGRNGRGQWIARERCGLYGGLFTSRAAAVRYALFENGHRPEAIVMIAGLIELDMTTARPPEALVAVADKQAA